MKRFVTNSAEETENLGAMLAEKLKDGGFVAFFGGMGMGKTVFVKGLAKALGIEDCITSPTFAIVNEYSGKVNLYHFDMYRVETLDDLYSTGFFDYTGEKNVIAVEWSENIVDALPDKYVSVKMEKGGHDGQRVVYIDFIGDDWTV